MIFKYTDRSKINKKSTFTSYIMYNACTSNFTLNGSLSELKNFNSDIRGRHLSFCPPQCFCSLVFNQIYSRYTAFAFARFFPHT